MQSLLITAEKFSMREVLEKYERAFGLTISRQEVKRIQTCHESTTSFVTYSNKPIGTVLLSQVPTPRVVGWLEE